ncbi:MAG: class I SAM-dependent methyltransferase [Prevotellaceae bacterium]|jgi:2-polyprenyl-3-methyl-5-hydroxy-6-metoxy-1,4-benzoquinol methylase|nr:class I SAM-dependent methyltransferase [Prevotellaceae bacterium]
MPQFKNDKCPVCGHTGYAKIGKSDLGTVKIEKPKEAWVVKCKRCKAIFANPMPVWSADDFAVLYNVEYFPPAKSFISKRWESHMSMGNTHRRFKVIQKYLKAENKRVLEFGAGVKAYMSKFLYAKGWSVTLQEPSKEFAAVLRNTCPHFEIIDSDFTHHQTHYQKITRYSLIYADSVMEHVHNPVDYLKRCAELLEPGGIFYFISPNEHSLKNAVKNIVSKVRKKPTPYIAPYTQPYHLVGFSGKGIKLASQKAGLLPVKRITRYDYMWWRMFEHKKRLPLSLLIAPLLFLVDLIGWGTNQEIILRKEI